MTYENLSHINKHIFSFQTMFQYVSLCSCRGNDACKNEVHSIKFLKNICLLRQTNGSSIYHGTKRTNVVFWRILYRHTKSSTMPKSEIPRQTISACPLNFDVRSSIFPDIKRECIAVKDSLSFVINIRLKSKLFTFHVKEYSCKKLFLFDEKLCMPSWEWDCLKYGITISQNEKKPQVRRYC